MREAQLGRWQPFQMHRLAVYNLVIGRPQLSNDIDRTDETVRWTNPNVTEVRSQPTASFQVHRSHLPGRSLGACRQEFVSLRLLPRFCVCAEWHDLGAHGAAIIDRDKERVAMAQMTEDRRRQEWAKITAEAWRDASFKQQLLSEPNQVLGRYGMAFPSNYTVKIIEQGSCRRRQYAAVPALRRGERRLLRGDAPAGQAVRACRGRTERRAARGGRRRRYHRLLLLQLLPLLQLLRQQPSASRLGGSCLTLSSEAGATVCSAQQAKLATGSDQQWRR